MDKAEKVESSECQNREGGNVGKRQADEFGAKQSGNVREQVGNMEKRQGGDGKKVLKNSKNLKKKQKQQQHKENLISKENVLIEIKGE